MSYAMRYFQKPEYLKLTRMQILKWSCSQLLYRYRYRFTVYGPQSSSLWLSKLHSLLEMAYRIKKEISFPRELYREVREIPLIHVSDSRYDIILYSLR